MKATLAVCGLAGIVLTGMLWQRDARVRAADTAAVASEEYGRRLIAETTVLMGPDHPDPAMRYTGNRLQCGSCHLQGGFEPGQLSLLESDPKYPRPSGRDGVVGDMKLRIQGCMTRSMNGRPLPNDSPEMHAMVAYIKAANARFKVMHASRKAVVEPKAFATPDRAANPAAGQVVFEARCARCHGADGQGLHAEHDPRRGYVYPPLWGDDSYNDGAGMNRVLTAARFIKAKMPLGQASLSDDEAFDVSAYINVQPRPHMAGLEKDYPDRATKPVDSPYGPWADDFPAAQHKFGPFKPIEAYYAALAAAKAKK
jgi:thiosulfate dehydrogenase